MTSYYQRLFAYENWANERIAECLQSMNQPDERALELLSHVLAAKITWLNRLNGITTFIPLWEKYDIIDCLLLLTQNNRAWETFLNTLTDEKLTSFVTYTNTKGEAYSTQVQEILTHVINHSTYHRGQMVSSLKGKISVLPVTDYIVFERIG